MRRIAYAEIIGATLRKLGSSDTPLDYGDPRVLPKEELEEIKKNPINFINWLTHQCRLACEHIKALIKTYEALKALESQSRNRVKELEERLAAYGETNKADTPPVMELQDAIKTIQYYKKINKSLEERLTAANKKIEDFENYPYNLGQMPQTAQKAVSDNCSVDVVLGVVFGACLFLLVCEFGRLQYLKSASEKNKKLHSQKKSGNHGLSPTLEQLKKSLGEAFSPKGP